MSPLALHREGPDEPDVLSVSPSELFGIVDIYRRYRGQYVLLTQQNEGKEPLFYVNGEGDVAQMHEPLRDLPDGPMQKTFLYYVDPHMPPKGYTFKQEGKKVQDVA